MVMAGKNMVTRLDIADIVEPILELAAAWSLDAESALHLMHVLPTMPSVTRSVLARRFPQFSPDALMAIKNDDRRLWLLQASDRTVVHPLASSLATASAAANDVAAVTWLQTTYPAAVDVPRAVSAAARTGAVAILDHLLPLIQAHNWSAVIDAAAYAGQMRTLKWAAEHRPASVRRQAAAALVLAIPTATPASIPTLEWLWAQHVEWAAEGSHVGDPIDPADALKYAPLSRVLSVPVLDYVAALMGPTRLADVAWDPAPAAGSGATDVLAWWYHKTGPSPLDASVLRTAVLAASLSGQAPALEWLWTRVAEARAVAMNDALGPYAPVVMRNAAKSGDLAVLEFWMEHDLATDTLLSPDCVMAAANTATTAGKVAVLQWLRDTTPSDAFPDVSGSSMFLLAALAPSSAQAIATFEWWWDAVQATTTSADDQPLKLDDHAVLLTLARAGHISALSWWWSRRSKVIATSPSASSLAAIAQAALPAGHVSVCAWWQQHISPLCTPPLAFPLPHLAGAPPAAQLAVLQWWSTAVMPTLFPPTDRAAVLRQVLPDVLGNCMRLGLLSSLDEVWELASRAGCDPVEIDVKVLAAVASDRGGDLAVLQWWRAHYPTAPFPHTVVEVASPRAHVHILEWWWRRVRGEFQVEFHFGKEFYSCPQSSLHWWMRKQDRFGVTLAITGMHGGEVAKKRIVVAGSGVLEIL
ncbi:hypothetical protein BC828DRAFT_382688 [Blastocladiella britannica]|nr:hypothetical protein BC828DRAFT_382688 [Blastocladiella britannica]